MSWLLSPTTATAVTIADESSDTTSFPLFVTAPTGALEPKTNAGLTFDASTGDLVSTLIAGIANANLLDRNGTEILGGQYSFGGGGTKFISMFNGTDIRFNGQTQALFYNTLDTALAQIGVASSDLSIVNTNLTDFNISGFTEIHLLDPTTVQDTLSVRTDINTATPPTSEAVTGYLQITDLAGDDILAQVGYAAGQTAQLNVSNLMYGGHVYITGANAAGTNKNFFIGDPDAGVTISAPTNFGLNVATSEQAILAVANGAVTLYYDNLAKLATSSTGITVTGDVSATSIGGVTLANLVDKTATEVISGDWEFTVADTNPSTLASALTANNLYLDGKLAVSGGDTFLRLNNSSEFSGGVFCPSPVRIDSNLRVGGASIYGTSSVSGDDYVISGTGTDQLSLVGFDLVIHNGVEMMLERAADRASIASYGQWWVKTAVPNLPMFTNDANVESQLARLAFDDTVSGQWNFSDYLTLSGSVAFPGAVTATANMYRSATLGLVQYGAGSSNDLYWANKNGSLVASVATGTQNIVYGGSGQYAGTLQASHFGGIVSASLLDKTADETITGTFRFESIRIEGDIVTATPPVAEAITASVLFTDSDGSDTIAQMGFLGSNVLYAGYNFMHGGAVRLAGQDTATGAFTLIFDGDPDGTAGMYYNGSVKIATAADGIDVTGDVGGTTIGGITEANLLDLSANEDVTGLWTFSANQVNVSGTSPKFGIIETDATVDEGITLIRQSSDAFKIQSATDAAPTTGVASLLSCARTGTAWTTLDLSCTLVRINDSRLRIDARGSGNVSGLDIRLDNSSTVQTILDVYSDANINVLDIRLTTTNGIQFFDPVNTQIPFAIVPGAYCSVRDGLGFRNYGPSDVAYSSFVHDDTDLIWNFNTTTDVNVTGLTGNFWLRDGVGLRITDTDDTDGVVMSHASAGGDFNHDFTLTTNLNFNDLTGAVRALDGASMQAYATGNAFGIGMRHDATNAYLETLGTASHLLLQAGAAKNVVIQGSGLMIQEQAAADADIAAYGQYWTKTATPNEPYFVNDAGDEQLIDPSVSTVNGQTTDYTLLIGDKGKTISFTGSTAAQTLTIPANASVAYPVGTMIAFNNDASVSVSIAITTDTLKWAADATTGTRVLQAGGLAVAIKVTSTLWKISGSLLLV